MSVSLEFCWQLSIRKCFKLLPAVFKGLYLHIHLWSHLYNFVLYDGPQHRCIFYNAVLSYIPIPFGKKTLNPKTRSVYLFIPLRSLELSSTIFIMNFNDGFSLAGQPRIQEKATVYGVRTAARTVTTQFATTAESSRTEHVKLQSLWTP
ncbi:hypothetical protein VNO78_20804 [Psophocarpus tetragonolobus]|uniref:Uncharacterized protein n=1 Tax=Psophocarpus tetragonolobus TaxID=3891 RepID=A0AAN9S9Y2_PSOTE